MKKYTEPQSNVLNIELQTIICGSDDKQLTISSETLDPTNNARAPMRPIVH